MALRRNTCRKCADGLCELISNGRIINSRLSVFSEDINDPVLKVGMSLFKLKTEIERGNLIFDQYLMTSSELKSGWILALAKIRDDSCLRNITP